MLSELWGRYQKESVRAPSGTVTVWLRVLSPLKATIEPSWADRQPECTGQATGNGRTTPPVVQPASAPSSNPPSTTPWAAGAPTVRVATAVWVVLGPEPVIVTGYVPGRVVEAVVTVSVEEPPAATEAGLKAAAAPAGSPLAERPTVTAPPAVTAVLTV